MTGVDEMLALRSVTRSQLEAEPGVTVASDVSYGALSGVDRLQANGFSSAHFYFDGDVLKLVYVPRAGVAGARAADWLEQLGPGPQLRSRTGRRAVLEVRPEVGFAFAHDEDIVELAEVFAPTTLDAYEHEIYEDPGPFIR